MKALLLFLLLLVVVWRWRTWRESTLQDSKRSAAASATTATLACRQCGLHVPATDAVQGADGVYCSVAHRTHMEP